MVPDPRNLSTEFSESRFPFLVERLGLAVDSGGAGRYRGGLGYEKHIRMLVDAHFMSIADRSILSCWGVRAGRPFSVTIDPGGPNEREVDALADAVHPFRGLDLLVGLLALIAAIVLVLPVAAGEVIRIRTTGGGGWGDPLSRPVEAVLRDVRLGMVSAAGALADYGVVVTGVRDSYDIDRPATVVAPADLAGQAAGPAVPRPGDGRCAAVRWARGGGTRLVVTQAGQSRCPPAEGISMSWTSVRRC